MARRACLPGEAEGEEHSWSLTHHILLHMGLNFTMWSDQAASNLDTWILSAENVITPNNINILLLKWLSLDKQISICVAGLIITHLSSLGCCFNINKIRRSSNESYNACAINVNCNIMGWSQFWNELKAQQLVTVQHILWDPTYFEFLGAHVYICIHSCSTVPLYSELL